MSTYTNNLGIEKPETGQQSGIWGATVNTNSDIIDRAISGNATITLSAAGSSGSPNTITTDEGALDDAGNAYLEFNDGGDLGATAYVQLGPNDSERIIRIKNSLSGSQSIIFFQGSYNASNDYELKNGNTAVLVFNGGGTGAVVIDGNDSIQIGSADITGTATITGTTTVASLTIGNEYVESTRVSTSGGALDLDPSLGTIWRLTLSSSVTFTDQMSNGESITLVITDGSDYTITWPSTEWITGNPPTLDTTNKTVITLWKVDSVLFGAFVGIAS